MVRSAFAAVAAAALVAAPGLAQEPDPTAGGAEPSDGPSLAAPDAETMVVIGRPMDLSLDDYIGEFVLEMADPPNDNVGFARWGGRICVGAYNFEQGPGEYIVNRVSDVAEEVGLGPRDEGCKPNIMIMFAADGSALARQWAEDEPGMFRPFGGVGGTTQGMEALNEFIASDAAVRWWQITMPVSDVGQPAVDLPGMRAVRGRPPTVRGGNSRITQLIKDEIWATYVIVDAAKAQGKTWAQLADYIAMVSLAQVDPNGSAAGYDSILNLFDSGAGSYVTALTDWDMTYLHALYDLDQQRVPSAQRQELVDLIAQRQLQE